MARPKTKITSRALKDYIEIALDELPPPSFVREVLQGRKRYPDWLDDALKELLIRGDHQTFATEEEYVKEILAGKAAFTWNFVRALHTILDIRVWNLEFEDLWQNEDASDLRYTPDAFRQILQKARKDHPDPFREFPSLSSPLSRSWISAAGPLPSDFPGSLPVPQALMQFGNLLPQEISDTSYPVAPVLSFISGAYYVLTFTARCDGRILLIGRDRQSKVDYLLNGILGLGGIGDLEAGKGYTGQVWRAIDQRGDWDLAVIFVCSDVLASEPDLTALLNRAAGQKPKNDGDDPSVIYEAEIAHICQLLRQAPANNANVVQLGLHHVQIRTT